MADVVRATLVLHDEGGKSLMEVLRNLQCDEPCTCADPCMHHPCKATRIAAGKYSVGLQLVRRKNKFERDADPVHFRNVLLNLRLTFHSAESKRRPDSIFVELQLHYGPILKLNDAAHAHQHYEYFRSTLQERYLASKSPACFPPSLTSQIMKTIRP